MSNLSDQLSLAGFGPEPVGRDRLFFAVLPDAPAVAQASAIAERLPADAASTRVRPNHLHVTLHHLGDHDGVPEAVIAMAGRAAQAVTATAASFELVFDELQRFDRSGGKPATVLTGQSGVGAVRDLQSLLAAEMKKAGLGQWVDKGFTPHMTLSYGRSSLTAQAIEPVAWAVRELVLVHSFIGQTRHEVLGRWPLHGGAR